MKVRLTTLWELTDELSDSFSGEFILVNRATGKAYGPEDIIEPYAFWGLKPAAVHVARMSNMKKYTDEEMGSIKRF
jgi:hypothetical protein